LRVLGKPSDFAQFYYQQGADEIMFMDVVASLYERNSLHEIISETAKSIFIPITVGGGIRSISDIKEVLRAGADKVCLNTAAINNPNLIKDATRIFGSSTIVVAIEAIRGNDGKYLAYTDNGREHTGVEVIEWARKLDEMKVGEIVITSVDKEGTGEGYDMELINSISNSISVPLIAHGGPGKKEDIPKVFLEGKADAIAISSILHYHFIKTKEMQSSDQEGNTEFLKQKRNFHSFEPCSILDIKHFLSNQKVSCRL
jgi:cyclase